MPKNLSILLVSDAKTLKLQDTMTQFTETYVDNVSFQCQKIGS